MSTKRDKVIETVKKLLAFTKRDSGAGVGEAATAMAKAQQLIEQYKIEEALLRDDHAGEDLAARELKAAKIGAFKLHTFDGPRVLTWVLNLAEAIGKVNGVRLWYHNGSKEDGTSACLEGAGTAEDVENMKLMLLLIMEEVERLYNEEKPAGLPQGEAKSWGFSFRSGCVLTIGQRLRDAKLAARKLLENKAKVEDLYQAATTYPEIAVNLDRLAGTSADPLLGAPMPEWAEKLHKAITVNNTGTALAKVDHAIDHVNNAFKRALEWQQKHVPLNKGAPRQSYGISDKGEARISPYEQGKKAGHRANIDGHKRPQLGG